uniref:Putative LOC102078014 [Oreochromis niloticus] n=1 Tax=Lepeophtheirus salmonis TaxID=72036 RepID=A0A0K2T0M6_LEPSM
MWLSRKKIMNCLWTKWRQEYLHELSISKKWLKSYTNLIKKGDTVALKPELFEKNSWKLGRVTKIHKNLDNVVNSATLISTNGRKFLRSSRQTDLLESKVAEKEMVESK